jgi:hypothetical protein
LRFAPSDKLRAFGFTTGYQLPSLRLGRTPCAEKCVSFS